MTDPDIKPFKDALIASDDYNKYKVEFTASAMAMIDVGLATLKDFKDHGGWTKAPTKPDTYFVFVRDTSKVENRYYLNAKTRELFQ